ncbi:MAG: histidine kinase, partial [Sphingobacteriales bacterium]
MIPLATIAAKPKARASAMRDRKGNCRDKRFMLRCFAHKLKASYATAEIRSTELPQTTTQAANRTTKSGRLLWLVPNRSLLENHRASSVLCHLLAKKLQLSFMIRRKDVVEKTYTDIRFRIALHLLFWVLLLASYYYFNTISFNPAKGTPATYLLAVHNAVTIATAYYSLMYFIWPRFFARKRWGAGILVVVGWVIAIATLVSWGDWLIFNRCASCGERLAIYSPDYYQFLQRGLPNIVFVRVLTGGLLYQLVIQLSFPVAIKIGRSYFRQAVQQLELAKDNLQLEFNFLKSQVNPHFLFNTLNNIYALVASQRNEQATATIAQLSGILRYTLYETGDEKILLEKEVQLLKDYVELEKLRLNATRVKLDFESDS